ncbi:hypothetical protein [Yeosuana sp.]|uniref:hypothetical protein n=1 Tax=Yeosuana sp. TaxID=2529388 RepID=UPI0040551376
MLKLYTDINFLIETHRKTVFPLLFDLHFLKNKDLSNYYSLVDDIQKCDIIVFPIDYTKFIKYKKAFSQLQKLSKIHKKLIWIYTAGDYGFTNYIPNSYTFRLSGFKSKLNENTFIMPSFINDPFNNYLPQGFLAIKKEVQPTIGFVGHAQSGLRKYINEINNHLKYNIKRKSQLLKVDKQPFYPSSILRVKYLFVLEKSKHIKTNFVLRSHYRAGARNEVEKQKSTQEFFNNIFNNSYTFCSRGVGNFSVRFYETLAVGRIPILLNTDCKLPLDNLIEWGNHCVILDVKNKISLEQQILNFHNSKSAESFEDIQKDNRLLWETHLKREMYFLKIHDIFINKENDNA